MCTAYRGQLIKLNIMTLRMQSKDARKQQGMLANADG